MSKDKILEEIKKMSVLDLSELVKDLEETFGVSATPAPVAIAAVAAPGAGTEAAAPVEEQSEFTVTLKDIGANKINVIKAVRAVTSLGLREAKELVESAPKAVSEGVSKEEATETQKKLQEAGATADIT